MSGLFAPTERRPPLGAVVVTPAWQLKTPFGHKTAGRMMQPQVGGILICVGDNGPYVKSKVWRIERSKEVTL